MSFSTICMLLLLLFIINILENDKCEKSGLINEYMMVIVHLLFTPFLNLN